MNKVYLGKIVNTHGIKGEIRILSSFDRKDIAFNIGNTLIIDNKEYKINTYRVHKNYDMVTLDGYNNINQVLFLKDKDVYIDRTIFKDIFLLSDYIGMDVISDTKYLGKVVDYYNGDNPLLKIELNNKYYYIPLNANYIKEVKDKVYVEEETKELIL